MGPHGEAQPGDGVFQQLLAFGRNRAMLSNHLRHHLRVRVSLFLAVKSFQLPVSCLDHPLPYGSRILRGSRCPQFLVLHGGHPNGNIHAIPHWAPEFPNGTRNHRGRALPLPPPPPPPPPPPRLPLAPPT